jgi:hypothetical protein
MILQTCIFHWTSSNVFAKWILKSYDLNPKFFLTLRHVGNLSMYPDIKDI